MKKFFMAILVAASVALSGCAKITDGEIGVRVTNNGTIQSEELQTGWHQDILGKILEFPIRELQVPLDNMQPLTSENAALADFDMSIIYNVNPNSVAELYKTKSKSLHYYNAETKDTFLMFNYLVNVSKNSAYKVVRQYKSLEVADNRVQIEQKILQNIQEQLKSEGLANAITLSAVQVRNVLPNAEILKSSTDLVKAENVLKTKQIEISIAKAESERMQALSTNSKASIELMQAQAQQTIANAIAAGKVQTIIVPHNMTSLMLK